MGRGSLQHKREEIEEERLHWFIEGVKMVRGHWATSYYGWAFGKRSRASEGLHMGCRKGNKRKASRGRRDWLRTLQFVILPFTIVPKLTSISVPTQITTFEINQTFAPYNTSDFFKPEVLRAWNELIPIGMGFQHIKRPELYHDLPTPIIWDQNKTVFTTSMTHQLHCLYAVVEVYSGLKSNVALPEDHHWHMIHCFDYMRQAIMCSADMALEGLETTFPDHNGGSDGWDSKHVCRDYSKVRSHLEKVRAYDDQEIF